jgi:cell division protein ZapA (FtsZ GTPase activity inhibitor)
MNEEVEIEIQRRRLKVEIEGLTEMEIHALARQVDDKMTQIAAESKIADSSKLAILTALTLAADLEKLSQLRETDRRIIQNKTDNLALVLKKGLADAGVLES